MKKLFGWLATGTFGLGLGVAIVFILAGMFVMRDQSVQNFLLAYGFQLCICFMVLSLIMNIAERRIPADYSFVEDNFEHLGPIIFLMGWLFLGMGLFLMALVSWRKASAENVMVLLSLLVGLGLFGIAQAFWPKRFKPQ